MSDRTTADRAGWASARQQEEWLRKAAAATLKAIAWDRRQAPKLLRRFFKVIYVRLFWLELTVEQAFAAAGIEDVTSASKAFRRFTGMTPWTYVRLARLETAARLLLQTPMKASEIAWLVGYESASSFRKSFREFSGLRPLEFRRLARRAVKRGGPLPSGTESPEYWQRAAEGELSDEESRELYAHVKGLFPSAEPEPTVASNRWSTLREQLAEAIAEQLDELSWANQRQLVGEALLFPDGTLFYELSERSLEVGETDPERGVELALLAIDSLSANTLLEVDPGTAAMARTRLARARWRAGDLTGADKALDAAACDLERTPKEDLEAPQEAERSRIEACYRWFRGDLDEASRWADYSVAQHREARSAELGKALLLRAELRFDRGEEALLPEALADLEEAASLLDESWGWIRLRCFDLWLRLLVELGDRVEVSGALPKARQLAEALGEEGAKARLCWFEGHHDRIMAGAREAPTERWRLAREEFERLGEDLWVSRTLHDEGRWLFGRNADPVEVSSRLAFTLGPLVESTEGLVAVRGLKSRPACAEAYTAVAEELASLERDQRRRDSWRLAG